jgi:PAS domain S-box-containing protein
MTILKIKVLIFGLNFGKELIKIFMENKKIIFSIIVNMTKNADFLSTVYLICNFLIGLAFLILAFQIITQLRKRSDVKLTRNHILVITFFVLTSLSFFVNYYLFIYSISYINVIVITFTAICAWIFVHFFLKNLTVIFGLKTQSQINKIIAERIGYLKNEIEELKHKNIDFESVINASNDVITIMTKDLNYKYLNKIFANFSPFDIINFIGKKPIEILSKHPHTIMFTNKLLLALNTKESINYEINTFAEKVGVKHFLVIMSPILDKEGNVESIITITRDISLLKQYEIKYENLLNEFDNLSRQLENIKKGN